MNQRVELVLQYPPTVNHYYVNVMVRSKKTGRSRAMRVVGKKGKDYHKSVRDEVQRLVLAGRLGAKIPLTTSLKATILVYPPDRRTRDLDNIFKCLFDALGQAGVYKDDKQIKHIDASMVEPFKGGKVEISLEEKA